MTARAHVVVEGLVQGVGFRWFAARSAQSLGLVGVVRNRYDGTVEIEAEGERSAVEELLKKLKIGPRSAHVTNLRIAWIDPCHTEHQFDIR